MNIINDRYNSTRTVSPTVGAERAPEIKTALENLAYQLKLQEEVVITLTSKLSPVLRQENTEKDQAYTGGALYNSPLACELGAMSAHVEAMNNKIAALIGRVEL